MEDWLSVANLSEKLEIPETTIRRYLNHFNEYFQSEKIGRGKKYHVHSIEVLQRIASLYDIDYERVDIEKVLANEYAFELNEKDTTISPPSYDVSAKLDELKHKQEQFNKELLQQLFQQQEYIKKLIDNREKEVGKFPSPAEARANRFDQIMAERKVSRLLESEALELWQKKPKDDRTKKVGWFRIEEDLHKRDLFIQRYVDKNFEEYLKKEFDIE